MLRKEGRVLRKESVKEGRKEGRKEGWMGIKDACSEIKEGRL